MAKVLGRVGYGSWSWDCVSGSWCNSNFGGIGFDGYLTVLNHDENLKWRCVTVWFDDWCLMAGWFVQGLFRHSESPMSRLEYYSIWTLLSGFFLSRCQDPIPPYATLRLLLKGTKGYIHDITNCRDKYLPLWHQLHAKQNFNTMSRIRYRVRQRLDRRGRVSTRVTASSAKLDDCKQYWLTPNGGRGISNYQCHHVGTGADA